MTVIPSINYFYCLICIKQRFYLRLALFIYSSLCFGSFFFIFIFALQKISEVITLIEENHLENTVGNSDRTFNYT